MIAYLITDPKFYGNTPDSISSTLFRSSQKYKIDYACLRDKATDNYERSAIEFISACKELSVKPILHTFWRQALNLGAFGVHFPTAYFADIALAKEKGLCVIASAHSLKEAKEAIELGVDFVTISPIFYTPDKNEPLGLVKLKEITDTIPNRCIALGGILKNSQIEACERVGAVGFASIRYFIN